MSKTLGPRRLPWVAASFVTSAAFLAIDGLLWDDFYPIATSANAALGGLYTGLLDLAWLVSSPLFAGYLVRRRFEYPLGGIFLTCTATSFLVSLAFFLVNRAIDPSSFNTSNSALFLSEAFTGSAIVSIVVASVIAAGASLGRRAVAKRQIPSVNPH